MQKKKFKYTVEFELQDFDKFRDSFPDFKYNYRTFEEWLQSLMEYYPGLTHILEGFTVKVKRVEC